MAHGQPDFGMYAQKVTTFGLSDMGELAARLGSIVTHDRRGDIVWFDDFESSLNKWTEGGDGLLHDAVISAASARNGGLSCKLTTGSTSTKVSQITHQGSGFVSSKVGIEVSFTLHASLKSFSVRLEFYDGTWRYVSEIKHQLAADTLTYSDSDGNPVVFATGVDLGDARALFHTLKMVIDFPNSRYHRVIVDHVEYDLSSYAVKKVGSGLAPLHVAYLNTDTDLGSNISSYVDDYIETQNEP